MIGLVMIAVAVVHWPALSARAIAFDDEQYMVNNRLVRHPGWTSVWRFLSEVLEPSTVGGYYQPLTMISLMADCTLGGGPDNLRPFHRTSLVLHAINAGLVVGLLFMLFRHLWVAAAVGLLFGLHPLTVEPIPWIGERKTLLAAFFCLVAMILYVRHARNGGWGWYAGCFVAYMLALMSKPTSTPLPLAFLLMDFWPLGRLSRRSVVEKLPLLALGAVFAVITVVSQGRTAHLTMPGEFAPGRIPLLLCHNILFYPMKMIWPVHLTSHVPPPDPLSLVDPMILAGLVFTCVLILVLLLSLRWTRACLTGWLIFFLMLLPTTGIIGFTTVIASDKYAYLPAVGLVMVLAWAMLRLLAAAATAGRARAVGSAMLAATLVLSGAEVRATRNQIARWQNSEGLYQYMISLAPRSARLHTVMGEILTDQGRLGEAADELRLAIDLNPAFAEAHDNLGIVLGQQNRLDEATACFEKSLSLWPNNAKAHSNLAIVLATQGRLAAAVRHFERSLALEPGSSKTHNNLATTLIRMGDVPQAMGHYQEAIRLDPDNVEARFNYACTLQMQGKRQDAIRAFRGLLAIAPAHKGARKAMDQLLNPPEAVPVSRSQPS